MIMQAVKGHTLNVYKGGNFFRDYIHTDDIVSAFNFLENKNIDNDTFLVGYGKPVYFKDMINYVHQLTDEKSEIKEIDFPFFHKVVGIGNFQADISKIKNLGWEAKINYKEGIKRTVDRYKALI